MVKQIIVVDKIPIRFRGFGLKIKITKVAHNCEEDPRPC